jgi:predicted dehydrogenase
MKIAVLGTGFGAYHVELYKKIEAVEQIFVYGRSPEKLQSLEEKFGVFGVRQVQDILKIPEIDLVDVCLPSSLHREFVVRTLEAGKPVYCETPLCLNLADTEAMLAASRRTGQAVFVDLFLRFEFPYTYLYGLHQKQVYGALKSFRIQRKTPPIWGNLGPEKICTELMIHDIDFTSWLFGKPQTVKAYCATGQPGQCAVTGIFEYGQAVAEVIASSMMPLSYPFAVAYEAVFEQAVVRYFEDSYPDRVQRALEVFTAAGVEKVEIPQGNCYEAAIRHVLDAVAGRVRPVNDINAAALSLEMALALQAQILGEPVAV